MTPSPDSNPAMTHSCDGLHYPAIDKILMDSKMNSNLSRRISPAPAVTAFCALNIGVRSGKGMSIGAAQTSPGR
jgi:hypothetical protein